ncbi:ribosome maturation factor RimM [Acetivibrio mesophilus]|uniref:Ribosome maturation factor RimM n=1 Tax=Acetivibrio mesophilus TaxID=2487273 RepID=A0A4Q0I440_9FIRM|nr:ribosome maturation factor RimM [Acetivibrio mesophilus]ODM28042.1 16S rRNA processing protein RimM [Clostridium sp. Bc-iso-3]RXE58475.1 16S rRNA processing protein RimM [Acetivibrio mesophilus]HHV28686.1 16S rRNA processing protein RimM [Clostridium sp.]
MVQYLQIGKIVNTHGVKGEVRVIPLTDDPLRFNKLKCVYISKEMSDEMQKFDIVSVKHQKNFVIIKFNGIDDMNAAERLKEHFVIIDRKDAVKLPKDTFFICDLINMNVFDHEGNNLGVLTDVLSTGSNDVYVVKNENKKEILIPALKSVVKEVCFENNKMVVELPQGLIDDEV